MAATSELESAPAWTLQPGASIKRRELHQLFGGGWQGGISSSATSPNVFLFSDPDSGEAHGYIDTWKDDGCFHYTGEGQCGDQEMVRGNRAILDASKEGRALRVFFADGPTAPCHGRYSRPYRRLHPLGR